MNRRIEIWIAILISLTLLLTIGMQVFWNIKNLESNKQRIINEIQHSFNEAIEQYYSLKAKNKYITIVSNDVKNNKLRRDSNKITINKVISTIDASLIDSMKIIKNDKKQKIFDEFSDIKVLHGKAAADSIKREDKINSILISISNDSINYKKLDSLFNNQLLLREIELKYTLYHEKNGNLFYQTDNDNYRNSVTTKASSSFINKDEEFYLKYSNPLRQAINRSIMGIILSILLALIIIFSLFYLLYIIRKQKQLSIIKNDLIGNITHEFKTPITTATAALEAIQKFNFLENRTKTNQYITISKENLNKLYLMVEKLLETATLDSENLSLNKKPLSIVMILKEIYNSSLVRTDKTIRLNMDVENLIISADPFHIENALENIVDNAIKYGGDLIEINLKEKDKVIEIEITDNGGKIAKNHRDKIFDKFYRIPKGNTHDVKGFGLGLFYSKEIIEKHGGSIKLITDNRTTNFKIELPYE